MPDDTLLLFIDAIHAKQMRRYLDAKHSGKYETVFFPHGGKHTQSDMTPISARKSDLIVFATLDDQISASFSSSDNWQKIFPDLNNTPFASQRKKLSNSRII